MIAQADAYPLSWPDGWVRTPSGRREVARFSKGERQHSSQPGGRSWMRKRDLTVSDGVRRVVQTLERMGARHVVISTNLQVRLDGLPRSGQAQPDDPGAAVYWTTKKGEQRCMAVDKFHKVADNLAAIAGTLEALRTVERYGGAAILDRAFTGFQSLPPPMDVRTWRQVLGIPEGASVAAADLEVYYRRARSEAHPDKGGTPEDFDAVQKAYEQAKREVRA